MKAIVLLLASGCVSAVEDPVLRIEPRTLELDVELGVPHQSEIHVYADDVDVTPNTTFALEGAPLGSADPNGFVASGSVGGRGQIIATFDDHQIAATVHVTLRSQRFAGAPPAAPEWFRDGVETEVDAALEPGDGAVLPPNLGMLGVHFAADDFEDVHEVAVKGPDLDLHVYAEGKAGPRDIELTREEWYAIAQSDLGGSVELTVKSLRIIARTNVHVAKANLRISELPIANEILFTGRAGAEMPQMWSYSTEGSQTSTWMPSMPANACLGCHVTISRDGRYVAAGGSDGTAGGGVILDSWTKTYTAPPASGIGIWMNAAYDVHGNLMTTTQGHLVQRDGTTGVIVRDLPTDLPVGQLAVSNAGNLLAYVGGPIDPVSTNPVSSELRIMRWGALTGTLDEPHTLIAPVEGEILKLPDFSPDDSWVLYSKVSGGKTGVFVRPTNGTFIPIELARDADFGRFASPKETVRAGGEVAEPMMWIVMKRYVPVGVRNQDRVGQLWAMAFFPERNVASRPFHLPGQRSDVAVLHAPSAVR